MRRHCSIVVRDSNAIINSVFCTINLFQPTHVCTACNTRPERLIYQRREFYNPPSKLAHPFNLKRPSPSKNGSLLTGTINGDLGLSRDRYVLRGYSQEPIGIDLTAVVGVGGVQARAHCNQRREHTAPAGGEKRSNRGIWVQTNLFALGTQCSRWRGRASYQDAPR